MFFSTFFYKENGYVKNEPQPKFWDGLKACLKNKSFLLFEVISITVIYAQSNLMNGLTAAWEMWGDEPGWLGSSTSQYLCLGAMAVGVVLALLFDTKMREKWGAKNLTLIMKQDDAIEIGERRETMRDQKHKRIAAFFAEMNQDFFFGLRVNRGKRIIEDQ